MASSDREDDERLLANTDSMQHFTATGRAYAPPTKAEKRQAALQNIGVEDTFGNLPANLLPFRYTDDSLISVPCLRPEDIGRPTASSADANPKKKFWQSRRKSKDGGINDRFVIKQVTRGEYLKHYAKDDQGRYAGTEEPAPDCMLRGPDLERWRGGTGGVSTTGN